MNIYHFEKSNKRKATKNDWFKNGVRTDLNLLIAQNTKQTELLQALIKKIDILGDEVVKLQTNPKRQI